MSTQSSRPRSDATEPFWKLSMAGTARMAPTRALWGVVPDCSRVRLAIARLKRTRTRSGMYAGAPSLDAPVPVGIGIVDGVVVATARPRGPAGSASDAGAWAGIVTRRQSNTMKEGLQSMRADSSHARGHETTPA